MLVEVLIYNLSLTISLRVECSKELNFNSKDIAECVLEIQYKLETAVRDNGLGGAIDPVNIVNKYMGYIFYNYSLKIKEGDRLFI